MSYHSNSSSDSNDNNDSSSNQSELEQIFIQKLTTIGTRKGEIFFLETKPDELITIFKQVAESCAFNVSWASNEEISNANKKLESALKIFKKSET